MRGHIRRQGRKSWAVVLDIGFDRRGRRRQKWHTVRGTKRDAEQELSRILRELDTGTYVEPTRLTVGEFLEQWLESHARRAVSAKTFERYAEIARKHLIPALGAHRLVDLRPLHVQTCYGEALVSGRRDGRGGLSAQTVVHHHRVLKQALKQAVRWQLLARNPADAVDPPRAQPTQPLALDEAATATLLRAAAGSRLYVPVLLAVATGLRRGELLALRWEDVDLAGARLSVCRALEQTREGLSFKVPKTPRSRRSIALPALLVEALREHRKEQAEARLRFGPVYQDMGLLCPAVDGTPWNPRAFTKAFSVLARRAGFEGVRFHDLRHAHASHLLRYGVHPKVVSERLGHATVAITLDRYSHVLPGLQEDAALKVDAALRAALEASS